MPTDDFQNIPPDSPAYQEEVRRRALMKLQEYRKKGIRGGKKPPVEEEKKLGPMGKDELWPGGPDAYGNRPQDFRIASNRRRAERGQGYA